MSIADQNLTAARDAYDHAVANWRAEQARGGIVELDRTDPADFENWKAGQRWKTTSPQGQRAMGAFQRAKAELDAAAAIVQVERGGSPAAETHEEHRYVPPRPGPMPDSRLPIERDEDAVVFP